MTARILLIDDDQSLVQSVQPVLAHLRFRVDHSAPGVDAVRKMLIDEPDLVILGIDPLEGWRFCHQLLPFLEQSSLFLLLQTDDEEDRVTGLSLGAEDCMAKPVAIGEFVARVQAILRRRAPQARKRQSFFIDGNLVVDLGHRDVRLNGEPVMLSAMEFRLLSCLVRQVDEVVSHKQLATKMWGPDHRRDPSGSLKSYIYNLRSKLEPDPKQPRRIVTHRGQGYMLQRLEA